MRLFSKALIAILSVAVISACNPKESKDKEKTDSNSTAVESVELSDQTADIYKKVKLTADVSNLSDNQKEVLKILFEVGQIMDDIFWQQAYGDKQELLSSIEDPELKKFAKINYGPWDRLNDNKPFMEGYGPKPKGANFYPADMTKEEFEAFENPDKESQYTLIRRDAEGNLKTVWYHEAYPEQTQEAADLLKKAAEIADDEGLKQYLNLRAEALLTDKYQESDFMWMDMKESVIDLVVGPIENYEDQLYSYKAAHEMFILLKDVEWSNRLAKYSQFLPQMQKDMPVDEKYKQETPGSDVDLNAYQVVFYGGDCNAGSKTIAINLPNDPKVQLEKGTRKLQLKNAMKAKFEEILVPISDVLIAEEQRKHITFDAFFSNTMFHEVAHGLGIKNVLGKDITVRKALQDQATAIEEGKADILGLYVVTKLHEMGELGDVDLMDNYVTFMASIFRSIRFGAASSHGKANMMRFNFFLQEGAFAKNDEGYYAIDFEKMQAAAIQLTNDILTIQGNGDYEAAKAYVEKWGGIGNELQSDLDKLTTQGIPVDIVYDQGVSNLNL